MNAPMARALAQDAIYQVVDNKVFRVLLVLVLIPILITFMIGLREHEVVVLFGAWRWSYDEIIESFGGHAPGGDFDFQGAIISSLVGFFVDFAGGKFGIMLAIAATAFFVPRMLEKGSADIFFHKPLGRFVIYLSRYFAGLIFIALVTAVAVAGMYLGLLLVSHYNDPGILWAALTMTYLFGLVHCVSMLVGVLTRSTVAAILVTLIFFMGTGCLQWSWVQKEQGLAFGAESLEELDDPDIAVEVEEPAHEAAPGGSGGMLLKSLMWTFNTAHYVLPKTSDAGYITDKLRASIEGGVPFEDPASGLTFRRLPSGVEPLDAAAQEPPLPGEEELLGAPAFAAGKEGGAWRLVLRSRDGVRREIEINGKVRNFPENVRQTASKLADDVQSKLGLAEDAVMVENRELEAGMSRTPSEPAFRSAAAYRVSWVAADRAELVVLVAAGGRFHSLEVSAPASASPEELAEWTDSIVRRVGIRNRAGEQDWYVERLGVTSELKYNILFSIGSSLAFALLMLLLGGWKLSRLDF